MIVIVDDEIELLEIFEESSSDLEVKLFTDSFEALCFIGKHKDEISLLITDKNMPGLSGIDLAESVQTIVPDIQMWLVSGDPVGPTDLFSKIYGKTELFRKLIRLNDAA